MNTADELVPTRQSLLSRLKNWDDQESWKVFFDTYWRLIYSAPSVLVPIPATPSRRRGIFLISFERFRSRLRVNSCMTLTMPSPPEDLIPTRYSLLSRLQDWDDQESWKDFFDTYWRLIYAVARRSGLTEAE